MIDINNLKKAFDTLCKANEDYKTYSGNSLSVYIKDSLVKRFEYTLEISWKLLKKILIKEYGVSDSELTMNNIFRLSMGYGFIKNWEDWKKYYQLRNIGAHEYSLEKSEDIIKTIADFINDVEYLISALEKKSV